MTIWQPDLSRHPGPRYQALAEAISNAIRAGELPHGTRLPPQRDLAWKLGIAVATVGRAYQLVEQLQLVSGQVGRGTFVLESSADVSDANEALIDLTSNLPSDIGQATALAVTMKELSQSSRLRSMLNYMPEAGDRRHREVGAAWLRRVGVDGSAQRVLITGGAQHAMSMSTLTLARPGDTVLTEKLTFSGVAAAIRLSGARPLGVEMDEEGVLPEAFDRAASETGARLAVLTPTVHSPTTATMGEGRRREIAEILNARDMILIEDDVYGFLPEACPAPIATLLPDRTVYVASASKCLAPGLGVGWLATDPRLRDRLTATLTAASQSLPALGPEILTRWIEDGTADRLVAAQRGETAARHGVAASTLEGLPWRGRPDAIHIFIELPQSWTNEQYVAESMRRGVIPCSARIFSPDGSAVTNAVRVSLGAARDHDALRRGLATLAELVKSGGAVETLRPRIV